MRLAQDFAARYPLIEGQGNFGNIDGDNAAAMRYTEARLTEVAKALLAGIDDDAVDFRPTYDGEESEPVVLPGGFPNLLANGAAGIAVGMATSIPPHNAGEVCAAAIALVRHPGSTPRGAAQAHARPRLPHRRHHGGGAGGHPGGLRDRPRRFPRCARNGRSSRASSAPGPSWSPKFPTRCRSRSWSSRSRSCMEEKKLPLLGRRARRKHRGGPPRAGAEEPQRRAGSADGEPVPRDRAGSPLPAQHERAVGGPHAAGDGPARRAAGLAGPSARGAGAPLEPPPGRHRAPAGNPRRLHQGLSSTSTR